MGRLRAALFVTRYMTDAMVRQGTITRRRAASELAIALGLSFNDRELLQQSLYHRSYLNEAPDREIESNERLEFLGDAVLGLIVSEKLYRDYPALSEGHLSQLRALLVRWDALRSEEHTSELQSPYDIVCRLLLEYK